MHFNSECESECESERGLNMMTGFSNIWETVCLLVNFNLCAMRNFVHFNGESKCEGKSDSNVMMGFSKKWETVCPLVNIKQSDMSKKIELDEVP